MQVFLKDAETPFDYVQRPYRSAGFTRQIVTILCQHLYSPGPSRTWDQPAGDEFLKQVYGDNHFDALMLRADELSTLNDVAAIQVDAGEGKFAEKPIRLRLWSAADFHAWTDPGDRTVPRVACTIDRFEEKDVLSLWTDESVRIYETPKNERLAGERSTRFLEEIPHKYRCLPFAFVNYSQPITTFWESGIGTHLSQAEIRMNDRLSRLDEAINKHLNPLPVAKNVDENWQPILEPQRFIKLRTARMKIGASGGMEDLAEPELSYLVAQIDVASAWDDLLRYINQVLESLQVPIAAVRMEQTGIASGIALVVEQAPLLTRARARRRPFGLYETEIARTVLRCAGNHYGKPGLVAAADAGRLTLGWPQPTVPVPTADNLELMMGQVSSGLKSLIMAVMEWYGLDRDGAIALLEQIEDDRRDLMKAAPSIAARLEPQQQQEGATPDDGADDAGGEDNRVSSDDDDNQSRDLKETILDL
jgi:hypothetical protein